MRKATQTLPEGYVLTHELNLAKNKKLAVVLNLIASALFLPILIGIIALGLGMRPDVYQSDGEITLLGTVLAAVSVIGIIVLHELVHGVFFWLYTRSRPIFAFHLAYAYAAAPDWYLPPGQYAVVSLSPLVLITISGILLFAVVPTSWVIVLAFLISINLAGAAGDALIVYRLWRAGPSCWVNDKGDAVYFYEKEQQGKAS